MAYKLICKNPMHGFKIGSEVTDAAEVERLISTHNHNFVKVEVPDPEPQPVNERPARAADVDKPAK